jgi:hypothetical protein
VPIDWSHDAQWVLVQDGSEACEVRASGGEYKCFTGFTMQSTATDGRWMVLLGPPSTKSKDKPKDKPKDKSKDKAAADDAPPPGDVAVPPPAGPLALYRGRLEGLYKEAPTMIVSSVDGAAVWVPKQP